MTLKGRRPTRWLEMMKERYTEERKEKRITWLRRLLWSEYNSLLFNKLQISNMKETLMISSRRQWQIEVVNKKLGFGRTCLVLFYWLSQSLEYFCTLRVHRVLPRKFIVVHHCLVSVKPRRTSPRQMFLPGENEPSSTLVHKRTDDQLCTNPERS